MEVSSGISVYIHIPFCIRKCRYCDFYSAPSGEAEREAYTAALIREIREYPLRPDMPDMPARAYAGKLQSIYFGGGTPSVLTPGQIGRILAAVMARFGSGADPEITMEINPGTDAASHMRDYAAAGINRLSIGIQSFRDAELRLLGRIHDSADAQRTVEAAREAGLLNFSLDIMSALPGQTMEDLMYSLEKAVSLEPAHLSVYSLILEPGTPFAAMQEAGTLPALPDEDTEREMAHACERFLGSEGYARYEISNYSRPGKESVHNTGYWTGRAYRGFGAAAASYIGDVRFTAAADTAGYIDAVRAGRPVPLAEQILLTESDRMEEYMFLGLRMKEGVSEAEFAGRFHRSIRDVYGPVLQEHLQAGLLEEADGRFRLTPYGTDVSNRVMADYLF